MTSFLARPKRTKTKRPVSFKTSTGRVRFKARRRPLRRKRVSW